MTKFFSYLFFLKFILNHPLNKGNTIRTLLKIFWWKINQIFLKSPCVVELVPGTKCICYPNDSLYSTLVVYLRFPEYGEMQFLLSILKRGDYFIDVGANIGVYSFLASSKITTGKIFAFEPSPKILPKLYENIALNQKKDRIEVIRKVVSDRSQLVNFDTSEYPDYNHISPNSGNKNTLRLESTTLDKFIKDQNIKKIKMIKIDVEGAEMLVLKGLEESLQGKKVDILIVEVNEEAYKSFCFSTKDTVSYLENYGFKNYMFDKKYNLINLVMEKNQGWNIIAIRK